MRTWLLWRPPPVTRVSQPPAIASAHRYSSLRTLFPPPAMAALLADAEPIPAEAHEPLDGAAVGNLLHQDAAGRFHVLAVVFPEGTSSGIHHHGCWGVIGYLNGSDEETRYRDAEPRSPPVEVSRYRWAA